ncbi:MAG: excinuclease ABC subunit C [Chitinophagaceae bacterium]|nr:MAG: excinuclease ABC subunit C [Chitinophagaceae bacterium]
MNIEKFKKIAGNIPEDPGVYKFLDKENKILYIGKAKNLNKRVSSYFLDSKMHSARIKLLIKKTVDIDIVVVETEQDALLLENSLIKTLQPKFNIQLKDDKTYPYICIKKERFPRIFLTRNKINDGSIYLGPYSSVNRVKSLLQLIRQLFPIRTCNYNLSEENIKNKKFKVCLEYHIENCLGPCEGLQNETDYNLGIQNALTILKGEINPVLNKLDEEMKEYAVNYEFEKAEKNRLRIEKLKSYQAKSTIVSPKIDNLDVFSFVMHEKNMFIHYMQVKKGSIVSNKTIELKQSLEEDKQELLNFAVNYILSEKKNPTKEIIVPLAVKTIDENIKITIPKIGDKKNLLELAYKNALFAKNERILRKNNLKIGKVRDLEKLEKIKKDLLMTKIPYKMECIDISTFQGKQTVGSVVVFENGKPCKSEYRKFTIKSFEGSNDFKGIYEVVKRRYSRLVEEDKELPQLLIIDGGKGQLRFALDALTEIGITEKIHLISIAKKLEEIYFPGDQYPLHIDKKSETLKIIQQLRNEAHRFAITFHREKRNKVTLNNELESIKGIGPSTTIKLIKHYKSVKKMRQASIEELASLIGLDKAKTIYSFLNNSKDPVQS